MTRRRVLALTTSPLPYGEHITDGPGYRMWNLLQEVGRFHDVRILSLYESFHEGRKGLDNIVEGSIELERHTHSPRAVSRRVSEIEPDVLYLPWSATMFLGDASQEIPTIIDYVGPGLLESFVAQGRIPLPLVRLQLDSFHYGDFLITTSARERHYLLGLMAASGRLSEGQFSRDDPLIHVVRMAPPVDPPKATARRPEPLGDELVVMLGGAFHPWYDYPMLASSLRTLSSEAKSSIRVVVLGGKPGMPEVEERIRGVLTEGGLHELVQFTGIVPFSRRAEYYLGSDVALSVSPVSVEDELSSRTRIVDYLWARLPIVTTGRDEYSSIVLDAGAGFRYSPNPQALSETLERLVRNRSLVSKAKARIERLLEGPFNLRRAAEPILDFLETPLLTDRSVPRDIGLKSAALWVRDVVQALRSGRM